MFTPIWQGARRATRRMGVAKDWLQSLLEFHLEFDGVERLPGLPDLGFDLPWDFRTAQQTVTGRDGVIVLSCHFSARPEFPYQVGTGHEVVVQRFPDLHIQSVDRFYQFRVFQTAISE